MAFRPTLPLPLIPETLLRRHSAFDRNDSRFRACARLLQSLWREAQQLPIGSHSGRNRPKRRLGSLISPAAADAGRNFLSPTIAAWVRREVVYQERGALIERGRLFGNLLSSMPLAANLFAPLGLDPRLAAKVLRGALPDLDLTKVNRIWLEHSPGRADPHFTGDRTAFDVAVDYERKDGSRCLLVFEVKYSESLSEPAPVEVLPTYDQLARASGLFKNPDTALLRVNPIQQLFREHLLAYAAAAGGDYAAVTFCLIAPRHNHLVQRGAALYAAHLSEPDAGPVPFVILDLERMIEAYAWAQRADYAFALHDRYCAWDKLDRVVDAALSTDGPSWTLLMPELRRPVSLVARAA